MTEIGMVGTTVRVFGFQTTLMPADRQAVDALLRGSKEDEYEALKIVMGAAQAESMGLGPVEIVTSKGADVYAPVASGHLTNGNHNGEGHNGHGGNGRKHKRPSRRQDCHRRQMYVRGR